MWLVRASSCLIKGALIQIAVDCYRIARPQLKFYIGGYSNKNNRRGKNKNKKTKTNKQKTTKQKTTISPRVCGIHLNSLCLKEEEIKSHFLNAGHRASGLEACSFILPIMQVKLFSNGIMSFTMEIPFIVHWQIENQSRKTSSMALCIQVGSTT